MGGGLREYSAGGRQVLDGYDAEAMVDGGRGQPLLPWPNRIADARYSFAGQQLQLPVNEVARNCAIHGLTRWSAWTAASHAESAVTMALSLFPQPGYPFLLELELTYRLSDSGLEITTRCVNRGDSEAPFGAGFHPYLAAAGGLVDGETLQLPSTRHLELDPRGIPTGRTVNAAGNPLDFSVPREIGHVQLDTCFTAPARDAEGRAEVRFGRTTVWFDGAFDYLMVFTGDTLEPDRRRRGLAVEPMTCPPNAFNSGEGLIVLQPGDEFLGTWGIRPS